LRIATKDFKKRLHRIQLDEIGRARPSVWAKYLAMNFVIKTLTSQAFVERSKPLRTKFFSKADLRIGRQAMVNRAGELMNDADFD